MRTPRRRRAIHLLVALLLLAGGAPARVAAQNGCADGGRTRIDDDGIGGTGAAPIDDDGIGGTGRRPATPPDDDGIGGTGIALGGDTGVIGTITGFASICVGNVEIHYEPRTPVQIDGRLGTVSDLAVGQVVEVVAAGAGPELTARSISVRHIVSGPVTSIDAAEGQISVAGQVVELTDAASDDPPVLGSIVRVSGMRRSDGVIEASRVTRAGGAVDLVQVTGPLEQLDSGALAIGGAEVIVDGAAAAVAGEEVCVVGRWSGDAIQAASIDALPRVPFDGRVARVDIEGFARATAAGALQVGAYRVDLAESEAAQSIAAGAHVRIEGLVQPGGVVVERVTVMAVPPIRPEKPQGGGRGRPPGGFDEHKPGEGRPEGPPRGEGGGERGSFGERGPQARHGGPPPRGERPEPPASVNRPDFPDHVDRPEPPEHVERPERPNRPDLPLGPGRPERPERPEGPPPGRPERPEIPHGARPYRPEPPAR